MVKFIPKNFNNYIEPFLGSGALFFYLLPDSGILSDKNEKLINCFLAIKNDFFELDGLLKNHEKEHFKDPINYFYYQRSLWLEGNNVEQAARFIYLNKTCYNGVFRENSKGLFNVSIGNYLEKRKIYDRDLLYSIHKILQNIDIFSCSYEDIYDKIKEKDFVYLDPPIQNNSGLYKFTKQDQINLKLMVDRIVKIKKAQIMLTNAESTFIKELYKDYHIYKINYPNSQKKKSELVIVSYDT